MGTLAAGHIADLYHPAVPEDNPPALSLPGMVMALVAIAGLIASLFLPRLRPGDKNVKYELNPLGTYLSAMREMAGTPLLIVMFAWAYFYFLAGLALLAIPEYIIVLEPYNVSHKEVSVLMGVMGVAIGIGCGLAGWMSGHAIRPRMIPFGALGLTIFFLLLGLVPPTLPDLPEHWRILASSISLFIFGAGVSAGFYIIPLQSLLQRLTPDHELGRFLGTANGLSFGFLLLSSLLYLAMRPAFTTAGGEEHPEKIFLVAAVLMIVGVCFFMWRIKARGFSFDKVE